jgi:hypothetical protein
VKRTEIHEGDVLYWDTTPDWEQQGNPGPFRRVVVVDAESRWRTVFDKLGDDEPGQGVLVEALTVGGDTKRRVLQPAHLRGPYDETLAHVLVVQAADREREDRQKAAQRERTANEMAAVDRATALGIPVSRNHATSGPGRVEVDVEVFEEILDALLRHGVVLRGQESDDPEAAST